MLRYGGKGVGETLSSSGHWRWMIDAFCSNLSSNASATNRNRVITSQFPLRHGSHAFSFPFLRRPIP